VAGLALGDSKGAGVERRVRGAARDAAGDALRALVSGRPRARTRRSVARPRTTGAVTCSSARRRLQGRLEPAGHPPQPRQREQGEDGLHGRAPGRMPQSSGRTFTGAEGSSTLALGPIRLGRSVFRGAVARDPSRPAIRTDPEASGRPSSRPAGARCTLIVFSKFPAPSHFLVDQARDHQRENLALAGVSFAKFYGQVRQPRPGGSLPLPSPPALSASNRSSSCTGFSRKFDRSVLIRLDRSRALSVRAEEDDGRRHRVRAELFASSMPSIPGIRRSVRTTTGASSGGGSGKQGCARWQTRAPVSRRLQKPAQGDADDSSSSTRNTIGGLAHGSPISLRFSRPASSARTPSRLGPLRATMRPPVCFDDGSADGQPIPIPFFS